MSEAITILLYLVVIHRVKTMDVKTWKHNTILYLAFILPLIRVLSAYTCQNLTLGFMAETKWIGIDRNEMIPKREFKSVKIFLAAWAPGIGYVFGMEYGMFCPDGLILHAD